MITGLCLAALGYFFFYQELNWDIVGGVLLILGIILFAQTADQALGALYARRKPADDRHPRG